MKTIYYIIARIEVSNVTIKDTIKELKKDARSMIEMNMFSDLYIATHKNRLVVYILLHDNKYKSPYDPERKNVISEDDIDIISHIVRKIGNGN